MLAFFAACLLVGVVGGVLWSQLSDLPGYVIGTDGVASTTERGLTEHFSGDAWFCLIGVGGGLVLGMLAWWRLRGLGWPVILVTMAGALAAAGLVWAVGSGLTAGDFDSRLADAQPGDAVPIDLTLRAPVALVVWPFFATIPILLWSSLAPDYEDPRPLFGPLPGGRRSRRRHESVAGVIPEDGDQLADSPSTRPRPDEGPPQGPRRAR